MIGKIIICLIIGYAFGCIETGIIVGKMNHIDIRNYGSGNSGSTNALRTLGKKAGAITFLGDVFKAIIPTLLVQYVIFPGLDLTKLLMLYTGLGVVLGHNFPCWLQFRGGKGIAATAGVMIVFSPIMSAFALGIFIVSAIVSKYVSLSSLLVTTFFPIWVAFAYRGDVHMLFVSMMFTVLAFYKHRANIDRLLHGTEYKIGERVSVK